MNDARRFVAIAAVLAFATTQAATPDSITGRVEQAARAVLLERAQGAGLANPAVEVTVVSSDTSKPCAHAETIEPVDTRYATRMRFASVCTDAPAFRAEFIVRGTLTADVVVVDANVHANRPIAASQLAIEHREVPAGAEVIADPDAVVGRSSKRALRRGQVLDKRWLVEPVLVQRGATVTIVARNVGVQVNVTGVAVDAGRRGEIITVRNVATGKVITVRVVGENAVEPVSMSAPQ